MHITYCHSAQASYWLQSAFKLKAKDDLTFPDVDV